MGPEDNPRDEMSDEELERLLLEDSTLADELDRLRAQYHRVRAAELYSLRDAIWTDPDVARKVRDVLDAAAKRHASIADTIAAERRM